MAIQIAFIFGDFCKIILVQGLLVLKFSINLAEIISEFSFEPSDYWTFRLLTSWTNALEQMIQADL